MARRSVRSAARAASPRDASRARSASASRAQARSQLGLGRLQAQPDRPASSAACGRRELLHPGLQAAGVVQRPRSRPPRRRQAAPGGSPAPARASAPAASARLGLGQARACVLELVRRSSSSPARPPAVRAPRAAAAASGAASGAPRWARPRARPPASGRGSCSARARIAGSGRHGGHHLPPRELGDVLDAERVGGIGHGHQQAVPGEGDRHRGVAAGAPRAEQVRRHGVAARRRPGPRRRSPWRSAMARASWSSVMRAALHQHPGHGGARAARGAHRLLHRGPVGEAQLDDHVAQESAPPGGIRGGRHAARRRAPWRCGRRRSGGPPPRGDGPIGPRRRLDEAHGLCAGVPQRARRTRRRTRGFHRPRGGGELSARARKTTECGTTLLPHHDPPGADGEWSARGRGLGTRLLDSERHSGDALFLRARVPGGRPRLRSPGGGAGCRGPRVPAPARPRSARDRGPGRARRDGARGGPLPRRPHVQPGRGGDHRHQRKDDHGVPRPAPAGGGRARHRACSEP